MTSILFKTPGRLLFMLLAAMLSACGGSVPQTAAPTTPAIPATQPALAPTTQPAAAPTALPEPAAAPTPQPEPTAAPVSDTILPAPLYHSANQQGGNNQIWRLERDGKTRTLLVEEPPAQGMLTIVELAVSPADGALAYLVQSADGYTLVHADADGKNRRELLPAGSISQLRWSPDGTQIAAAVYRAPDATAGLAGGVYLIPPAGGAPRLLQANDPIPDPANPAPESRGYSPEAWSEDGEALILNAYSQAVELCDVAVRYVATDDLVVLEAPEGLHTRCGSAVWDPQGQNIYVGMSRPGYLAPIPGLWRAIPTNGRTVPYIPAEPEPGRFNLVVAPKPLADGALNFFLATVDKLEEPGDDPNRPPAQYGIFQLSADTTQRQQLRDDRFADIENRVLWAADGSGALVEQGIDPGTGFGKLRWVPTSGAPAVELASDLSIGNLRWGP